MAAWFRALLLGAFLFPALVESLVRHYKFSVSAFSNIYFVAFSCSTHKKLGMPCNI